MVKIIILLAFAIILADARKHHLEIRVRNCEKMMMKANFSKFSHIFLKLFRMIFVNTFRLAPLDFIKRAILLLR
jgi:hypothetical protein